MPKSRFADPCERLYAFNELKTLSASGTVSVQSLYGNLPLSVDVQYRTTDTLIIQVYDPLGRKLAKAELNGDEYMVLLQRSGKYYYGVDLPKEIINYFPSGQKIRQIRLLFFGIVVPSDSADGIDKPSAIVTSFFKKTNLPKIIHLSDNANQPATIIRYEHYIAVHEIPIPSDIKIEISGDNEIEIHLSNFSAELRKFTQ